MRTAFKSAVIGAAISLTALSTSARAETNPMSVFNSYIQGFSTGDIDLMTANLTEDTVIVVPGATYTGIAEIEGYLSGQIQEFSQEGVSFEMGEMRVVGKIVYISWSAQTPDNSYTYATETFLIEDGKIAVQTVGWFKQSN